MTVKFLLFEKTYLFCGLAGQLYQKLINVI